MKPLDAIDDIKSVLEFYRAMGFAMLPLQVPSVSLPHHEGILDKNVLLDKLRGALTGCTRCTLSKQRKSIVFGEGDPDAKLMFIGEAPGREEDIQGRPFVGEAGMLLTRLIRKMGFKRSTVFIANIVKCRPPLNRDPEDSEIDMCIPFLKRQIEIINPEVIITLGRIALQVLMDNNDLKITAVRGNFFDYKSIPVMPTFHPAYLLRNPKDKWLTWNDMQKVLERITDQRDRETT